MGNMKKVFCLVLALGTPLPAFPGAAAPSRSPEPAPVLLAPPVKRMTRGKAHFRLPQEVAIALPAAPGPVVQYAAGQLAGELRERFGRKPALRRTPHSGGPPSPATIALEIDPALPLPRQGYMLSVVSGKAGAPPVRIIGKDGPGLLYGATTLRALLEQSLDGALPSPLHIRDWPTLEVRAYTGCVRDASADSLRTLDWLARWRINAVYYEIKADRGQDKAPPVVKQITREAARRGIAVYGCVSNWRTNRYLKRPLCPANPKDVALVSGWFEALAKAGCTGLVFLFDDLPASAVEHPKTCPACKARFHDLAGSQAFWMKRMAAIARRHGITRLLMCPTPYYRGWPRAAGGRIDGVAYFARLGPVCSRLGVDMFFCPYRPEAVSRVVAAGLRRFVWWYNGDYPLERVARGRLAMPGVWAGFQNLEFGWYNTRWDARRGIVVLPDVRSALRTLPARTRSAWLCAGGSFPWALWGIYTWAPERYNPQTARRAAITAMLGAWRDYETWERIVRDWLSVPVSRRLAAGPRTAAAKKAVLDRLAADIAAATRAAAAAAHPKTALASAKTVRETTARMQKSVQELQKLYEQGRSGRTIVQVHPAKKSHREHGVRIDQIFTLQSFETTYTLRYAVIQEKNGSCHRCKWHFGSGLGMPGPSNRNWYDAGFIDVLVGGHSLDETRAAFTRPSPERLCAAWKTPRGAVVLAFHLRPDAGLDIEGTFTPVPALAAKPPAVQVKLWCIPGAGWGSWKDMDKWMATAARKLEHPRNIRIDPAREPWILFYDKTYDVPRPHAEGPAGLLLDPENIGPATIALGNYIVEITLPLKPGHTRFHLAVWDFHGAKNADVLAAWHAHPPALTAPGKTGPPPK